MKKTLDIILIIIIFFVIYFLQSNFFTWFNISGIMPNLFVVLAIVIGLFLRETYGFVFGVIFGICLDFFISSKIGINTLALAIIGLISGLLYKSFTKTNKLTLISLVGVLTLFAEFIIYVIDIVFLKIYVDVLAFIKIVLIEIIYNVILVIIFYPLICKFGNKLEDDFLKSNNFLKILR